MTGTLEDEPVAWSDVLLVDADAPDEDAWKSGGDVGLLVGGFTGCQPTAARRDASSAGFENIPPPY